MVQRRAARPQKAQRAGYYEPGWSQVNQQGGIALKKVTVIVLALALAACATVVFGQVGAPSGQGQGGQGRGQGFAGGITCPAMALSPPPAMLIDRVDTLQLSDEKKANLKAVLTKIDDALRPSRQKAIESSRALREAVMASTYDAEKVKLLVPEAQNADAAILTAELQAWVEIRAAITPDQFSKLQEFMTSRRMGAGQGGRQRRPAPDGGTTTPPPPAPAD